jgi:hypothetical protein
VTDRIDTTDEFDRDDGLRALLAAADPAHALAPADPAGLSALLEDLMSHDTQARTEPELGSRMTGTHGRNPLTWLVAAAAVVMIAGVGAFGLSRMNDDGPAVEAGDNPARSSSTTDTTDAGPAVTELGAPPAVAAKCAVPTAKMLATQEQAFAGTVTAIEGDTVTLSTSTVYTGEVGEQVQVTAPSAELHALLDAVRFEVGRDYLVSASGGVVSVCSFSGPASPGLQRLYEQAFPVPEPVE